MSVLIAMLRGVNVGGKNKIKMDALCALCTSFGFEEPRTYVQSGNVIFRTRERSSAALATRLQDAIARKFGFSPAVVLRTTSEFRAAIAANPLAGREFEPGKLLVTFLADDPGATANSALEAFKSYPEEIHLKGRELYIYFPKGAGQSKLPWASVEKWLKVPRTARNWNSVTKILEIAEALAADPAGKTTAPAKRKTAPRNK